MRRYNTDHLCVAAMVGAVLGWAGFALVMIYSLWTSNE